MNGIGRRIRTLRLARGWTQTQLADLAGLYFTTISEIERGVTRPTVATLEKIAAPLGTTVAWLLHNGPEQN